MPRPCGTGTNWWPGTDAGWDFRGKRLRTYVNGTVVLSTALGGDWEFRGIRPPARS